MYGKPKDTVHIEVRYIEVLVYKAPVSCIMYILSTENCQDLVSFRDTWLNGSYTTHFEELKDEGRYR